MKFFTVKLGALCAALAIVCLPTRPQSDPAREWTDKHFLSAF
jgi:hypothetical protein